MSNIFYIQFVTNSNGPIQIREQKGKTEKQAISFLRRRIGPSLRVVNHHQGNGAYKIFYRAKNPRSYNAKFTHVDTIIASDFLTALNKLKTKVGYDIIFQSGLVL